MNVRRRRRPSNRDLQRAAGSGTPRLKFVQQRQRRQPDHLDSDSCQRPTLKARPSTDTTAPRPRRPSARCPSTTAESSRHSHPVVRSFTTSVRSMGRHPPPLWLRRRCSTSPISPPPTVPSTPSSAAAVLPPAASSAPQLRRRMPPPWRLAALRQPGVDSSAGQGGAGRDGGSGRFPWAARGRRRPGQRAEGHRCQPDRSADDRDSVAAGGSLEHRPAELLVQLGREAEEHDLHPRRHLRVPALPPTPCRLPSETVVTR